MLHMLINIYTDNDTTTLSIVELKFLLSKGTFYSHNFLTRAYCLKRTIWKNICFFKIKTHVCQTF
jgi:hypothetical protein